MKIDFVKARQVFDSRGNPTVEAEVKAGKITERAIVASGASTGSNEAIELRDKEKAFKGRGVLKAVENINKKISPKLKGMDVTQQKEIDKAMIELDGTENKSVLGANAVASVSMAVAKAGAKVQEVPLYEYLGQLAENKKFCLPIPQMNVLNGGKHAGLEHDIQERMIYPFGAKSFFEAMQMSTEIYHSLKALMKKKFGYSAGLIGDEGGFVSSEKDEEKKLELILNAVEETGYSGKVELAIDPASTEFYKNGKYFLGNKIFSAGELVDFYSELAEKFNIYSIEDGMAEEDWKGWNELNEALGNKYQIVGDDLLVTNIKFIERAIKENSCNSLLLKVNQIGSVSESIDSALLAFKNSWTVVVSHRSGETEDSFIADLVVGLGTGQSKFGAPARSDRNAKYNQLLRIEDSMKNSVYGKR
ncbi:MAG: phosphopyruvate hydratase [Candidatus Diapherotrites archaeon CG10_big_fil_rev_8_21_14_0_10_31_34]|nr:MAG: phosphopyruvate hydratase [Candidatus Diapherotrites archaeon CG10_big_fil_rev_8_21_14_0_10_31_34]